MPAATPHSPIEPRARAIATLPRAPEISRAEAAPTPDVHIHIGRIELTALPEATPPRRSSKPAKAPLSLDEYLRGRSGRP